MPIEHVFALSAILLGLGIGAALSHRNLFSIVMSIVTSGLGVLILMTAITVSQAPQSIEGILFGPCLIVWLLILLIFGCAMAYKRFVSCGVTEISDKNQLRN